MYLYLGKLPRMKRSTTAATAQGGPTFDALVEASGKTTPMLVVETGASATTLWRCTKGIAPRPIYVRALAAALGRSEEEVRAAIEASRGTSRKRAKRGAA